MSTRSPIEGLVYLYEKKIERGEKAVEKTKADLGHIAERICSVIREGGDPGYDARVMASYSATFEKAKEELAQLKQYLVELLFAAKG